MKRTWICDLSSFVGKDVTIAGWVHVRRDHGKLIFIDLRDETGKVQVVLNPSRAEEAHAVAHDARSEWVLHITGTVKERPEKLINPDELNGRIEFEAHELKIISEAQTPPFDITEDTRAVGEETRLKYRYLDLRSERMQRNLRLRHKVTTLVRKYFNEHGFVEIETPTLTKTSPEGARDFIVPSRFHPGTFYALPQAPQQYKQLLMLSGFERYFQIAHALRDEDLRGDRQLEHTQIDVEMAHVTEEELRATVEDMFKTVVTELGYTLTTDPFPVIPYSEAMKKYGADKFDLRKDPSNTKELAFAWVTDFPLFEKDEKTGNLTFAHNPFSAPKPEDIDKLMKGENLESLKAQQYDLVLNGYEVASGGVRISDPAVQRKVFETMGLSQEEADKRFGHLLEAYTYGAPSHAGIAPGLDRFIMILAGEENIREVIAFPVSSGGQTSVMDAPSDVSKEQLDELGIEIKKKK